MAVSRYLVTNDSDLEFNLQKLFHDYVALYVKLHFPDSRNAVSHAARRELILKLQKAVNEMALLVSKMKRFKSETGHLKLQPATRQQFNYCSWNQVDLRT